METDENSKVNLSLLTEPISVQVIDEDCEIHLTQENLQQQSNKNSQVQQLPAQINENSVRKKRPKRSDPWSPIVKLSKTMRNSIMENAKPIAEQPVVYAPVPKKKGRNKKPVTEGNTKKYNKGNKDLTCRQFDDIIKQGMKLSCHICKMDMESFFILKEHCQCVHEEVGHVTCCNINFTSRSKLALHILLHQDPDIFKCEECGKVLSSKKSLKTHMQVHLEIFKCNMCARGFSCQHKLDCHLRTHDLTDKTCNECGKVHRNRGALRRHQQQVHPYLFVR